MCLDWYYFIFAKIVQMKMQMMGKKAINDRCDLGQSLMKGAQIAGKIRKSSFFGSWDEKMAVVNSSGLVIYKSGEKIDTIVGYGAVRQIWTRFDFEGDNLVIKFLTGSKIQLGIAVGNFLSRDNWLFHLYNLCNKG